MFLKHLLRVSDRSFGIHKYLCGFRGQYSTVQDVDSPQNQAKSMPRSKKISRAMMAFMEKSKAYDKLMGEEIAEYEIGRLHLAKMMGKPAETFTPTDIKKAIEYLMPSRLAHSARPLMEHPTKLFPPKKSVQFDVHGRPFSFLFYTKFSELYHVMHDAVQELEKLNIHQDNQLRNNAPPQPEDKMLISDSQWISHSELKTALTEPINQNMYQQFTLLMNRLVQHPYSKLSSSFLSKYRKPYVSKSLIGESIPLMYDESGRPYMEAKSKSKRCYAEVRVVGNGSGKITVNNKEFLNYFPALYAREIIMYPLQLCDMLHKVDVHATITYSDLVKYVTAGKTSNALAIRHGISLCLKSFVSQDLQHKMYIAGLLTADPRMKERKKPGQEGAHRKFTWKKR